MLVVTSLDQSPTPYPAATSQTPSINVYGLSRRKSEPPPAGSSAGKFALEIQITAVFEGHEMYLGISSRNHPVDPWPVLDFLRDTAFGRDAVYDDSGDMVGDGGGRQWRVLWWTAGGSVVA
ncbi:mitogen-activated protein kinase CPK1, partial [Striga asiatica]